jgi:formate hydrogenlyase transcriptional activator
VGRRSAPAVRKLGVKAPVPVNEQERLKALRGSGILDTAPERSYDQITELAAGICGAPVAILSLIDSDRQWFKSKIGIAVTETPRDIAFCAHTILDRDLLVVPDATADQRFLDNPLVTSEPHIRFYAGAPLITPEGHALGTLCVLDYVPRQLSAQQREALRVLSSQAVAQIELRKTKTELENAESSAESAFEALRASEEFKSRLLACSRDCIKVLDLEGRLIYMNEGGMQSLEICDLAPVLNSAWIDFWEGQDRDAALRAVETARRGEVGRFIGFFSTRITHQPRWWDVIVSPIFDSAGKPERILALSRDVTAQKLSETALRDAMQFNRAIIQDAGEGIIVYDRELRYKVFNPFMERLTGKRAEEALGKVATDVFPRLRSNGIEALLKRALTGEVVKISDVLIPKHSAQGGDVWESCTFAPQYDGEGNVIGVIGLVFDVTDRHLSEETFRAIVVGTASATGSDFFPSLVKHMAAALRMRYAFITACDNAKRAKALAFWKGDGFGENFEFDVEGTPCLKVVQGEICHYRDELVKLFPLDTPLAELGARSYLGVPMLDQNGRVIGHIAIIDDKPMERDNRAIDLLKIFAARAAAELKRQRAETELQAALQQVQELQKKLEAENVYLQEEIRKEHNFEEVVGNSRGLLDVLRRVETVAPTDSTVLILGETGCGKELIARAIHNHSQRKHRPLVKVNCGAIPTGLVESELFGHMKGAFTGALERRTGRFELADGGSLFLDEVSELPLDTQVKLLRVLQEHEFEPLGSSRTIQVNVRIIAASNRDLEKAVQEGRFRADLFYRLNVLPITLPPLRERRTDIPLLASFFVERFSRQFGKQISGTSQETMDLLSRYSWPGNIRELQNVIERAVVLCPGTVLRLGKDLLPAAGEQREDEIVSTSARVAQTDSPNSLENVERAHIVQVLLETRGVIEGPRGAAKILNLHPNTLRSRMKKLGIERPVSEPNASATAPV